MHAFLHLVVWATVAAAATACSVDDVTFILGNSPEEDCSTPGDEDGNGLADCADAACAGTPSCQATVCTAERCDGLDNDCNGIADDKEAVGTASACAAASCVDIQDRNPAAADGVWWVAPPGGAPFQAYCDMHGGGWTLVMNQVPGADLPDEQATVNPSALGSLDQSYRFGNPAITTIRPTSAWKLTDDLNSVFFAPTCVVDWSVDYLGRPASPCTVGYTTEQLVTPYNGGYINVATRGIGINNSARFCSMRAYNTVSQGSFVAGPAATCLYTRTESVRLWYR